MVCHCLFLVSYSVPRSDLLIYDLMGGIAPAPPHVGFQVQWAIHCYTLDLTILTCCNISYMYVTPQLDPAPSFRCVSVAEATEIADRLYAGHRKKNDGSQEQGRSQTNNNQHQTACTSAAGSSEAADSTSTNKSPVVSVTPAALCCIHPLWFLFYTPLLHVDVVVYTSSTPHYCIHTVTILLFIILSFILISPQISWILYMYLC